MSILQSLLSLIWNIKVLKKYLLKEDDQGKWKEGGKKKVKNERREERRTKQKKEEGNTGKRSVNLLEYSRISGRS